MIDVKKLIANFDLYFTSANGIDVDARISVPRDEWRALKTAIAQRLEADEWQPIETAQKDGKEIILLDSDGHIGGAMWFDRGYVENGDDVALWTLRSDGDSWISPTHWKPLPKGPQ